MAICQVLFYLEEWRSISSIGGAMNGVIDVVEVNTVLSSEIKKTLLISTVVTDPWPSKDASR